MAAALPYVSSPGNVEKALTGIKAAATPETVSQDFVKTILKIQGGPGNEMTSYLRKIGFAATDGKPTELYRRFRNTATEGQAALEALKVGYKALYVRNEYMHDLPDDKLRGLVIEETGEEQNSRVVGLVMSCIKGLKKYAKAATQADATQLRAIKTQTKDDSPPSADRVRKTIGMNLSYTIQPEPSRDNRRRCVQCDLQKPEGKPTEGLRWLTWTISYARSECPVI
jgi:hypothetical protein